MLSAAFFAVSDIAGGQSMADLPAHEQDVLAGSCANPVFGAGYMHREDLNYDKREDLILNGGAVSCDGNPPPDCTTMGCPFRIYALGRDGSYTYVGEVDGYAYRTQYRFGVKIMIFRVPGNECGEASVPAVCKLIVRLQGTDLRLLSRETGTEWP